MTIINNRPLKVYLGRHTNCNKNLTFLNQTVFEPFLSENIHNIIDVGRGCAHISCDRRIQWIFAGNYEHQVKNFKCKDDLIGTDLKKEKIGWTSLTPTLNSNSVPNRKSESNISVRALNVDENE